MTDYQFDAIRNDIAFYAILTMSAVVQEPWARWFLVAIAMLILIFRPRRSAERYAA